MLPSAPASGSLFAAWTLRGGQASLDVRDLQGTLIATVAIVNGTPKRPAVWLGSDRLAYVDNGVLKLVDLHAMPVPLPSTIKVDRGSVEGGGVVKAHPWQWAGFARRLPVLRLQIDPVVIPQPLHQGDRVRIGDSVFRFDPAAD